MTKLVKNMSYWARYGGGGGRNLGVNGFATGGGVSTIFLFLFLSFGVWLAKGQKVFKKIEKMFFISPRCQPSNSKCPPLRAQ